MAGASRARREDDVKDIVDKLNTSERIGPGFSAAPDTAGTAQSVVSFLGQAKRRRPTEEGEEEKTKEAATEAEASPGAVGSPPAPVGATPAGFNALALIKDLSKEPPLWMDHPEDHWLDWYHKGLDTYHKEPPKQESKQEPKQEPTQPAAIEMPQKATETPPEAKETPEAVTDAPQAAGATPEAAGQTVLLVPAAVPQVQQQQQQPQMPPPAKMLSAMLPGMLNGQLVTSEDLQAGQRVRQQLQSQHAQLTDLSTSMASLEGSVRSLASSLKQGLRSNSTAEQQQRQLQLQQSLEEQQQQQLQLQQSLQGLSVRVKAVEEAQVRDEKQAVDDARRLFDEEQQRMHEQDERLRKLEYWVQNKVGSVGQKIVLAQPAASEAKTGNRGTEGTPHVSYTQRPPSMASADQNESLRRHQETLMTHAKSKKHAEVHRRKHEELH